MTHDDIHAIEAALGIVLPRVYVELLTAELPEEIADSARESNAILWDDRDTLIKANLEYRAGFSWMPGWPHHFYLVGEDGAASAYVIDVRLVDPPVLKLDHGHPEKIYPEGAALRAWLDRHITELNEVESLPTGCTWLTGLAMAAVVGAVVTYVWRSF